MSREHPKYPGIRITTNGNQLVSYHTEARITQGGVFYPITPSTEMGENYQLSYAEGVLDVFGNSKIAIETEGEHSAQGGAIALSMSGHRVVNFTSGQGVVYGLEQYYHAPGKLSTMVLEVAARALTKHALNVHCGHDDVYAALDAGWIMLFAKDSQQAADQALIARKVAELALNPAINVQDGFLTSHLERTFFKHESGLLREFLGAHDEMIDTPTPAQRELFGPTRRRVPVMMDLKNPMLLGPVENQEHYMNGVIARRNNFTEEILPMLEAAYEEFAELTGRDYGLVSQYRNDDADVTFVSLGSAAENIEAAVDFLREQDGAKVGSVHINVVRPLPEAAVVKALAGKSKIIVLESADDGLSGDNQITREIRAVMSKAYEIHSLGYPSDIPGVSFEDMPEILSGSYGLGSRDFRPEDIIGAYEYSMGDIARQDGKTIEDGATYFTLGIIHPYAVVSERKPSLLPDGSIAVRFHSIAGWGMITTGKNLSEVIGAIGDDLSKASTRSTSSVAEGDHPCLRESEVWVGEEGRPDAVLPCRSARADPCELRPSPRRRCPLPRSEDLYAHEPAHGHEPGGTFVWESDEDPVMVWERIPREYRQEVIDKKIRIFTIPGFRIAREATDRPNSNFVCRATPFSAPSSAFRGCSMNTG